MVAITGEDARRQAPEMETELARDSVFHCTVLRVDRVLIGVIGIAAARGVHSLKLNEGVDTKPYSNLTKGREHGGAARWGGVHAHLREEGKQTKEVLRCAFSLRNIMSWNGSD